MGIDLRRLLRHLFATRWLTRRRFPPATLARIEQAISELEARHGGEVRVAVETAYELDELRAGLSPRERALQVFGLLGVWDTAENNGVLIYVSMADRDVEIVADRGIAARVPQAEWDAACRLIEEHFRAGRFGEGMIAGIEGVGLLLARHFPQPARARDELPNQAILL